MTSLVAWVIPSPGQGVWHLGPVPIRAYALCIIAGIIAAIWIGDRRWTARGGEPGAVADVAMWAVPFGVVGGRLYHVATDYDLYFGPGRHPIEALYVWRGGLGIWGAIALGAVGAIIAAKRRGIPILPFLDAVAPGILIAQALGRWGNWFNQELYGRTTDLPWRLEIDVRDGAGDIVGHTYHHPTFLYESLWCLGAFVVLVWADRRFRLGDGRVLALYVVLYTAGRVWIENLRVDPVQLSNVGGFRFNVWMSLILFVLGLLAFWLRRGAPRTQLNASEDDVSIPEDALE